MAKKTNGSLLKTFLFWMLSLLAITGFFMLLNGPVGLKAGEEVVCVDFKSLVNGSEGLNLGIVILGKVEGTKFPLIALIAAGVGALLAFGSHLFIKARGVNFFVVVGAALLVAAGVFTFISAANYVSINSFNADDYVLTQYGVLSAIFTLVSGLGFGVLEFLF